jgi:hypothetical protein
MRHAHFARECGFVTLFRCLMCREFAQVTHGHTIIAAPDPSPVNPRVDNFAVECACSVWAVKQ